ALVGTQQRGQVARALRVVAVAQERRADEVDRRGEEAGGRVEAGELLGEDQRLRGRAAAAAPAPRPGDPRPAAVEERALPRAAALEVLALRLGGVRARAARP